MLHSGSDRYWESVADAIRTHIKAGDRLIAPVEFKKEFSNVAPYTSVGLKDLDQCRWALIHKGMIGKLDRNVLNSIVKTFTPVFANEVFVVFSSDKTVNLGKLDASHINPFWKDVAPQNVVKDDQLLGPVKRAFRSIKAFRNSKSSASNHRELSDRLSTISQRLERLEKTVKKLEQNSKKSALIYTNKSLSELSLPDFTIACRAACQTMYLGDGVALCRILAKHLMYVDTSDIGIAPHLSLNGYWEPDITLITARLLEPGWYCIDVGANHGYFSLLMANAVGSSGRMVALEPNPKLVTLLKRSIELNGFESYASVIQKAASAHDNEQLHLFIPQGQTGHASLVANPASLDNTITVDTITIDTLTRDWPQVNFVKIDAEGAEQIIWEGMRETIRKHHDIIILLEFGATRYADPKSFLLDIQQEGFVLRHMEGGEIRTLTIEQCLTQRLDTFWMLFLQRS